MKHFLLTFLETWFGILIILTIEKNLVPSHLFDKIGLLTILGLQILTIVLGLLKKTSKIWMLNVFLTFLYIYISSWIYFEYGNII